MIQHLRINDVGNGGRLNVKAWATKSIANDWVGRLLGGSLKRKAGSTGLVRLTRACR
jgi:hypothetical protein